MKEELICTICPLGCSLEIEHDTKSIITIQGNECKRGLTYAEKEIFHPERTVTTTVRISGSDIPLLPVKTDSPVPREMCQNIVQEAGTLCVTAPVKAGEVVAGNILGTGCNLVATRSVPGRYIPRKR